MGRFVRDIYEQLTIRQTIGGDFVDVDYTLSEAEGPMINVEATATPGREAETIQEVKRRAHEILEQTQLSEQDTN